MQQATNFLDFSAAYHHMTHLMNTQMTGVIPGFTGGVHPALLHMTSPGLWNEDGRTMFIGSSRHTTGKFPWADTAIQNGISPSKPTTSSFSIDAILNSSTKKHSSQDETASVTNHYLRTTPSPCHTQDTLTHTFHSITDYSNDATDALNLSKATKSKLDLKNNWQKTKTKRMRTIFSPEQLEKLEQEFQKQQYMVGSERLYLAATLHLTEAQVKVWFQNRRIKWRKQNFEKHKSKMAATIISEQEDEQEYADSE